MKIQHCRKLQNSTQSNSVFVPSYPQHSTTTSKKTLINKFGTVDAMELKKYGQGYLQWHDLHTEFHKALILDTGC
jgi:hypothetical protein